MKEKANDIALLITGHMQGNLTPDQQQRLNDWVQSAENRHLFDRLSEPDQLQALLREYYQTQETLASLEHLTPVVDIKISRTKKYYWWAAAASFFLIATCAYLFIFSPTYKNDLAKTEKSVIKDIQPGGQKATLILSDNSTVNLTDMPEGIVAHQGETAIKKSEDGDLRYEGKGSEGINTLMTPRGGFYHLIFSDGSKVWLNAESSIRYPVNFSGKERRVELVSGEAYFEVSKNAKMPFIVQTDKFDIQVLGTRFNCQMYDNESANLTTLVEGSIRISTGDNLFNTLIPGQQAVIPKASSRVSNIATVDAEASVAWVKGKFYFNQVKLQDVTRQLERWYAVKFVYDADVAKEAGTFEGGFERSIPLSKMLQNLSRIGNFHFKIQDENTVLLSKVMN